MEVDRRIIVAPADRERTAVVTIAIPAGGELELDRAWRFVGWLRLSHQRRHTVKLVIETPARISIEDDSGEP